MNYKIVSDSSSNLLHLEGVSYSSVPLHILVGEQCFVDDDNLDLVKMQKELDSYDGKTSTSCPSPDDWIQAFGEAEVVFCVTITSSLSGAYSSCNVAKQMYESDHPGRTVYIFDSLSTGPEMMLIILKLKELIEKGMYHSAIAESIKEYQKITHLYFALASVDNLAKNGRVNPLLAKGISVLGIRVIGRASEEGTLESMDKCRGEKKAIVKLVEHMEKEGYNGGYVVITHSDNLSGAEALRDKIIQKFGSFRGCIRKNTGLCTYYAEPQNLMLGFEA